MAKGPPTPETIKDGLVALVRAVNQLKKEVEDVRAMLSVFKQGKDDEFPMSYPSTPYSAEVYGRTAEPEQKLVDVKWAYEDTSDLEAPTRIIAMMARDLDGALLDVRATRLDIEAIAANPRLKKAFETWLERRR